MEWIKIEDAKPEEGKNVIAVGTWCGEISGRGDSDYMGIGTWSKNHVDVDADAYYLWIVDVTHWMYIPAHP
jgi:hypothetical protein